MDPVPANAVYPAQEGVDKWLFYPKWESQVIDFVEFKNREIVFFNTLAGGNPGAGKAGECSAYPSALSWIPACAGMTA